MMTNEERALWKQTWEQPHMIAGMKELRDAAEVSGDLEGLPPGYDAVVLAAAARWFSQGQANILHAIKKLGQSVIVRKDPGEPFQAPEDYIEKRR